MRNLKALGLAVVAVLAMSAFVASAAQASNFTAAKYPTVIKGVQINGEHNFTAAGTGVKCKEAAFSGEATGPTKDLTISAAYGTCKDEIFGLSATVTMNGCNYTFTEPASGEVDLVCPAGKIVEVHASTCTITVFPKNGLKTSTYTNGASDVTLKANVTGIEYQVDRGFLCPIASTYATKHSDGIYEGEATVTGTSGGEAVKVDVG
jgi:hypothetical protein